MKSIKSCVCALLALILVFSLASCDTAKEKIVGTYDLVSSRGGGMDISEQQMEIFRASGLSATLEVRDDNTAEMDIYGNKVEMTYNLSKMIFIVNGKNTKFTFDGSKITIVSNGTTMVFLKRD
jgi:hypothetical protein